MLSITSESQLYLLQFNAHEALHAFVYVRQIHMTKNNNEAF